MMMNTPYVLPIHLSKLLIWLSRVQGYDLRVAREDKTHYQWFVIFIYKYSSTNLQRLLQTRNNMGEEDRRQLTNINE